MKLTPNVTDITEIAKAAETGGGRFYFSNQYNYGYENRCTEKKILCCQ